MDPAPNHNPAPPAAPPAPPPAPPAAPPPAPPANVPPPPPAAPADLELKLPDGVTANEDYVKGLKAKAKELGLTQKQLQDLGDFHFGTTQKLAGIAAEAAKAKAASEAQAWDQTKAGWVEAAKQDKEFGGQNFAASSDVANKALLAYFDPATVKWLQDTGLASYPGLWKGLVKMGKATADDSIEPGGSGGGDGAPTVEGTIRSVFPNSGEAMLKNRRAR